MLAKSVHKRRAFPDPFSHFSIKFASGAAVSDSKILRTFATTILAVGFFAWASPRAAWAQSTTPVSAKRSGALSAGEFSALIRDLSEPGGDFPSDNLTSNELQFLHITGKLKELGVSGGAYVGVGPEQNFSYIAKIRPRIAFIVDIRRQAMVQHLMYKAIFHLARDRAQFLFWLFSRPPAPTASQKGVSLEELLQYVRETPGSERLMRDNLVIIVKTIQEDFLVPLSPDDARALQDIYAAFWQENLGLGFGPGRGPMPPEAWGFPNLGDLILARDQHAQQAGFLAHEADYQFVRALQENNRVIPVVGDFAGSHALAAVAEYLRSHDYKLSAFYTSNVEEYLYDNGVFSAFAANVCQMPTSSHSVIVRAVRDKWRPHSFFAAGQRITTYLQKLPAFCSGFRKGRFPDYYHLVTTDFIADGEQSKGALPPPPEAAPDTIGH